MRRAAVLVGCVAALIICFIGESRRGRPPQTRGVQVEEHLGGVVPKDLEFTNTVGNEVRFGSLFDGRRPVVLVLHYSRCKMLCHLVLEAVASAVKKMDLVPGKDYRLAAVSFDPTETPAQSSRKQARVLRAAGYPGRRDLWPFLIGTAADIHALTNALGFEYKYDPSSRQYAHPAVVFVLSPKGRISRYLYGISFKADNLRRSLVEASAGETGSLVDQVSLTCFRYDAASRKGARHLAEFFRISALLTLLAGAVLVVVIRRRRRRRC